LLLLSPMKAYAQTTITADSAILMEASTGTILYEKNATDHVSPASVTKIMTMLLTMEAIHNQEIQLEDTVIVSEHASSMGGSQVFLAEGETQTLDTMLKCIAVASANDACVAVAEHISGSEESFVDRMNQKAMSLGMNNTHFVDCCGLTDDDAHYSCALDVAVMSRELMLKYPEITNYTTIWMEDIIHKTAKGESVFGLSSTNKLLKQYEWTTGLKTGSTSKAKYCISATAKKDGNELIAVIMGADTSKHRFSEARSLLSYGYSILRVYEDTGEDTTCFLQVMGGTTELVSCHRKQPFRYVDTQGFDFGKIEKTVETQDAIQAPCPAGTAVGIISYYYEGKLLGQVELVTGESVEAADFLDCIRKTILFWLL